MDWYFIMDGISGQEEFGPYDSEEDALAGIRRIIATIDEGRNAGKLWAEPDRAFTYPYEEGDDEYAEFESMDSFREEE